MKQPIWILLLLLCTGVYPLRTQTLSNGETGRTRSVFLLGSNDTGVAAITRDYPANLMSVCGDSMDQAYEHWMQLLVEMENFSRQQQFDLKGLKIWINVFWNKNGTIDHISYYPKPNCRNIPFAELTAFLKAFMDQYDSGKQTGINYCHYGSASFPTHARVLLSEKN